DSPYVSRGGEKLAGALDAFGLEVRDLVALDVGASTGGFTDCLLQRGARRVIALDVGYGQLAWKLRQDPRVAVIERTNARHRTPACARQRSDWASRCVARQNPCCPAPKATARCSSGSRGRRTLLGALVSCAQRRPGCRCRRSRCYARAGLPRAYHRAAHTALF